MKIYNFLIFVSLLFNTFIFGQHNPNCEVNTCNTNVLNVNTGVDQNNNTLYPATDPATAQDGFWQLVNAPANQSINFGPAWVIDPNPAWATDPNSNWISAFNVDDNNANNDAPANPYTFERCFCVCEDTELTFDLNIFADDQVADVWLDGTQLIPSPAYTPGSTDHFVDGIPPINVTIPVAQGEHCLSIDIRNQSGVAMGLMVVGDIIGANLLTSSCCDDSGNICGFKFNDANQNGVWDTNESTLQGWTIEINGPNNYFSQQQTDQFGNYCFNDLPPGTYTVSEVNQPGWVQTFPSNPNTHTINLGQNQVASGINFGNFQEGGGEPCGLVAEYAIKTIEGCYAEFLDISSLPVGDIVCTTWDFGDGTTYNGGPSVSHYYSAPGVYTVCLTVLAIVDGECCEEVYCRRIEVEGCEPEPCKIEVDFGFANTDCLYEFNGVITFANTNIDVWFWDFGDGTTGTGQQVYHNYSPGSYVVCLTAIVKPEGKEDCCVYKICKEIFIEECQFGFSNETDKELHRTGVPSEGEKNKIKPIRLFPNPTNGILNIESQISKPTQLTISDLTGKVVYRSMDVSNFHEVNLESLRLVPGIYFVELNNETDRFKEKFVYQK